MQLPETNPLEQFVLLAKQARGAAAAKLVQQALAAPNVYAFGELLQCPNIQDLEKSEDTSGFLKLLMIFAYGCYADYVANRDSLPTLNDNEKRKLQQLTICSLATERKRIPYPVLQQHTLIGNVRELEDIIIDAIYNDLLLGKLDQRLQMLEIERCCGRDVREEKISFLLSTLIQWNIRCDSMIKSLDREIAICNQRRVENRQEQKEQEAKITQLRKQLKICTSGQSGGGGAEFDDLPPEVTSSASPHPPTFSDLDRKKDKKARFGLRGSGQQRQSLFK